MCQWIHNELVIDNQLSKTHCVASEGIINAVAPLFPKNIPLPPCPVMGWLQPAARSAIPFAYA